MVTDVGGLSGGRATGEGELTVSGETCSAFK